MSTCGQACGSCGKSQPDADLSAVLMPEEGGGDADDRIQAEEQGPVRSLGTAAALNSMCDGEHAGASPVCCQAADQG